MLIRDFFAGVRRNKRKAIGLTLYAVVTVLVVGARARAFADAPTVLVPIARGAAAGIYLNFALVMLPMMRLTLSRRWMDPLRVLLPFHKKILAHMIAGTAALVFAAIHVAAYLGLYLWEHEVYAAAAYPSAVATGLGLTVLMAALGWGTLMRHRSHFEYFYFSHMLTIPIGVLAFLHGPWMAAVVGAPLGLYLIDRLVRVLYMTKAAEVTQVAPSGRDLDLVISRPDGFSYRAGDYAFLCIPSISRFQWHPFSLINAPAECGALSFRIRRYGTWTKALAEVEAGARVYIDGPFSTPCRDLYEVDRAIVVAAGIGITPFVSFLTAWSAGQADMKRLHLYWLERDESSFERFYPLLRKLDIEHGDELQVKLVADQPLARARPMFVDGPLCWNDELEWLSEEKDMAGTTLFFCGPAGLSKVLRIATLRAGFDFRTESF